jgi:type I restriction enzyme S subunit
MKRTAEVSSEFVNLWLKSPAFFDQLDRGNGATVDTLTIQKLQSVEIAVPPLAEQQRIVGLLDEAFEGLATAKANAEKNLQNARALFESHLQSVFTQRGEGWVQRRLGDLVTRLTNGYVGPTRNIYYDTGVPYLLARHVKDNRLKFDGKTFITDEFNRKNKKSILKAGDVLLVQSGHIGHSAVVTEEHVGHNCHAMIVITAVEGAFIGPFLSLFFNSSGMKQKFQEIRSGSTVPHLTCGEVKELMIPLPDLATQRRVVAHSQELNEETRSLARLYERKLAALEELKKSLLHQAFSGEL